MAVSGRRVAAPPRTDTRANLTGWRWWLAWYWERAGEPTALQVVDELQRLTGTTVPAARVWACQYASYSQWDLSTVYGPLDWS